MITDTACHHNVDGCCWQCSDIIPWWREARGGDDPPNPPMPRACLPDRQAWLNEETVSLPNCVIAGCEKSAVGPRRMCATHYSQALSELHRWEAQNALRRAAAAGRI